MLFVDQLCSAHKDVMRSEVIGKTAEGRHIRAITFGYPETKKPVLWINAGIHAREWISHSSALYFMSQLATNPEWNEVLTKIDIVVSPNLNPDGYEFSRKDDRLWRKNRAVYNNVSCAGADLNRNFPFQWKFLVIETFNCGGVEAEIYPGPKAASELESQALMDAVNKRLDRVKGYVDLHSTGEQILYPFGYSQQTSPPDVQELISMANEMKMAISKVSGRNYKIQSSGSMYPAHGTSDDWAKSVGIKYVYTIELPAGGPAKFDGFGATEDMIIPVGEEFTAAIKVLAEAIVTQFTQK